MQNQLWKKSNQRCDGDVPHLAGVAHLMNFREIQLYAEKLNSTSIDKRTATLINHTTNACNKNLLTFSSL